MDREMAMLSQSDRRVLRQVAWVALIGVLGVWIVWSLLLVPLAGPSAFLLVPLMVADGAGRSLGETLWPASSFQPFGLCQCHFPEGPEAGTAVEVAVGEGSRFVPTGEAWQDGRAVAQGSPDGAYVALVSHSGPSRPGGLHVLALGKRWWDVHLDVYSVDTGRKVATFSWLRMLSERPSRVRASWGPNRTLLWSAEVQAGRWGNCQTPPRRLPLPNFPNASFTFGGNDVAAVRVVPIDADRNGRMEALVVDANFAARRAGAYRLSARIGRPKPYDLYPGFAPSMDDVIAEVSEVRSAGKAQLRLSFDARELGAVHGEGPLVLFGMELEGEGQKLTSNEIYALPVLPPVDTARFEFDGQSETMTTGDLIEVSFRFLTPAGSCRWSGEMSQGAKRIPFTGSEQFAEGSNTIRHKMRRSDWTTSPQRPIRVRILTMECGGRTARRRPEDTELVSEEIDQLP